MCSTFANSERRSPKQPRAAIRRARFLEVAANLFGEYGYDGVTMTAVAEKAGASIGTLYDYFPDKPAIALALMQRYTEEAGEHWAALLAHSEIEGEGALAELFVEGIMKFVAERPAYLPLSGGPFGYKRSAAEREPLRRTIAGALQTLNPNLFADRAFLSAQVLVGLIKAMLGVYKEVTEENHKVVVDEFKQLMRSYLTQAVMGRN